MGCLPDPFQGMEPKELDELPELPAIDTPLSFTVDQHENAPQPVDFGPPGDQMHPRDQFLPGDIAPTIAVEKVEKSFAESSCLLAGFEFGQGGHHFGKLRLFEGLAALEFFLKDRLKHRGQFQPKAGPAIGPPQVCRFDFDVV